MSEYSCHKLLAKLSCTYMYIGSKMVRRSKSKLGVCVENR